MYACLFFAFSVPRGWLGFVYLPFRLELFAGSADDERTMLSVLLFCEE
jgi:hypothetical protein